MNSHHSVVMHILLDVIPVRYLGVPTVLAVLLVFFRIFFSLEWFIKIKTMKFKFIHNWYLKHDKFNIISEFITTHSTEEISDVFATEPRKFLLIKHHILITSVECITFYNFI